LIFDADRVSVQIAGDIFLFKALVELGPRLVTLLHAMAAPPAAVIGWLLLGEVYGPRQWLGIGVTLAGVALVIISFERPTGFSGWMNQNGAGGIFTCRQGGAQTR